MADLPEIWLSTIGTSWPAPQLSRGAVSLVVETADIVSWGLEGSSIDGLNSRDSGERFLASRAAARRLAFLDLPIVALLEKPANCSEWVWRRPSCHLSCETPRFIIARFRLAYDTTLPVFAPYGPRLWKTNLCSDHCCLSLPYRNDARGCKMTFFWACPPPKLWLMTVKCTIHSKHS